MSDPDRSSPGKPEFGRTQIFSITRSKGCLDSAYQRCCFLILMGIGQHHRPDELCSRVDAELAIHLREVVLDCCRTDEKTMGDLCVAGSLRRHPCDLGFLRGQVVLGVISSLARTLPSGPELDLRPLSEVVDPERVELFVSGLKQRARIAPPTLTTQPFAEQELRLGELEIHLWVRQQCDRSNESSFSFGAGRSHGLGSCEQRGGKRCLDHFHVLCELSESRIQHPSVAPPDI